MRRWLHHVFLTVIAAFIGYGVGWVVGAIGYVFPSQNNFSFLAERKPLPHHVPEHPGGVSFRFAMVHDVIVERFSKHGPAYYAERNRLTREQMAKLAADDPARFALADDLGTGLERLGKSADAASVIRTKLEVQRQKGLDGRALYTSYANLGTFLIHGSYPRAAVGDQAAKEQMREGIDFIHKAVEVNPVAHFGRERWQAAIAEFLYASLNDPGLLKTFDCLGNRLDLEIEAILNRELYRSMNEYGRPSDQGFKEIKTIVTLPGNSISIRDHITKIGAETGWDVVTTSSHVKPAPFDEPCLGIIGMWRQGGGANPHFALALGETMLRVGQRYLAWFAYERAKRLADRYSADPATQQFLRDHCQKRQHEIEMTLSFQPTAPSRSTPWQTISPYHPGGSGDELRSKFESELAFGQDFQRQYQEFETTKLGAGNSIDDPHFFDAFYANRPAIASPTGPEEWYVGVPRAKMYAYTDQRRIVFGTLGAGIAALVTSLLLNFMSKRKGLTLSRAS